MEISGDARVFLVINTTEYNKDGRWAVQSVGLPSLEGLGFDAEEIFEISNLAIGDSLPGRDWSGVLIVRVA